jgi:hypothetical protein
LSDMALLNHLNATYPVQPCWTLVHPSSDILSAVNSALLKKLQPLASPPDAVTPMTPHGVSGKTSVWNCARIPTLTTLTTPSHFYNCSGLRLELERWKAPFAPWARRSPHWDSTIHACSRPENSIYACHIK